MTRVLAVLILFIGSQSAHANMTFNFELGSSYSAAGYQEGNSTQSKFSGLEHHFGFESKIKQGLFRSYDIGLVAKIFSNKLDNKNNGALGTETSTGTQMEFGARIYALNLFIGLGAAGGKKALKFTDASGETNTKYSDFGGYLEIGFTTHLSSYFYLTPNLKYRTLNGDAVQSEAESLKADHLNAGLALGISF